MTCMDSAITIDREAPPPHHRAGFLKYPLDALTVGDAMKVRATPGALLQAVRRYKHRHPDGGIFTVRNIGGGFSKVYRVA